MSEDGFDWSVENVRKVNLELQDMGWIWEDEHGKWRMTEAGWQQRWRLKALHIPEEAALELPDSTRRPHE